jgi:uncharacterized protein (TIGR02246 family)
MRRIPVCLLKSIPLLAAASLTVSLGACAAGPRTVEPGVPPQIKHSWEVLFNQGNANAVADLYAPDGQLVMSGSAPIRGTADIRHALEDMIKADTEVRINVEKNIGAGDIAYVYGTYSILERKSGRETERGSYVEVWRRRNGVWAIDLDVNAAGEAH